MKIKINIFIVIVITSCQKKTQPESSIVPVGNAIVGILPFQNVEFKEQNYYTLEINFKASMKDAISWVYSWPVVIDTLSHIDYDTFEKDSMRLLSYKKYLIFANNSINYKFNEIENLYSIKCTINYFNNEEVYCSIMVCKLQ